MLAMHIAITWHKVTTLNILEDTGQGATKDILIQMERKTYHHNTGSVTSTNNADFFSVI